VCQTEIAGHSYLDILFSKEVPKIVSKKSLTSKLDGATKLWHELISTENIAFCRLDYLVGLRSGQVR
jgi:hypothetical protein